MTDYIILKKDERDTKDDKDAWIRLDGFQSAASSHAAIKSALNGADEGGTFNAVPASSWQPVTVSIAKVVKIG